MPGSWSLGLRYREITGENEDALRESRGYRMQMRPGMKMMVSAKGRSYSNIFSD